ncbi:MAG: PhoH family protein [Erysipelotrichaceae bacterium]|nr:PhoH family protein [Erysipelotrichaceae bacterium]
MIAIYESQGCIETQDIISLLHNSYYKQFIVSGIGSRKYYLRTTGQKRLYDSFEDNVITFAIGPAGTGKTFLAVCYAYSLLKQGSIRRIIITRPVVESGESLGFLPGDLREKVDPYLRPIYDAFEVLCGQENLQKMIEKNIIEISPLAYMRGRTLNEACVILDEAQNTTPMQIKMFMTRLGFNSKMIITGDITQIDLPAFKPSGLLQAVKIVEGIEGISVIYMHNYDVVRHPLVSRIIDAYEKAG